MSSEHVLADGTHLSIRPLEAADAAALRAAWAKLSPESRRSRFMGAVALSDSMVRYLTEVDGKDHIALAAVVTSPDLKEETGVGVARCIRLHGEPDVAEAAVTVVDDMQGRGVARALVQALATEARGAGIRRFRGELLPDNAKVRALLSDLGIVPTLNADGTMVFEVDISSVPALGGEPASPLRRWMRSAISRIRKAPPGSS